MRFEVELAPSRRARWWSVVPIALALVACAGEGTRPASGHASGLDALVQDSRVRGIVEGAGDRSCRFRFVLAEEEVSVGDRVITSGFDGVFPKGLPVGIVSDLQRSRNGLFQFIEVAPAADFMKLEDVLILTEVKPVVDMAKPAKGAEK